MVRKIGLVAGAIFLFGTIFGFGTALAKEYKIGFVDLPKVFDEYKKTKTAAKELDDKRAAKEAERKAMVDELRKMRDEMSLMSEKAKGEKQALYESKEKILRDFETKVGSELMKERQDKLNAIMKDIEKVTSDYAKETSYDLILNTRFMLYGNEQYDLTSEILKRLNK